MKWLLRGCLTVASVLLALLGFGVGLCGFLFGTQGGGLLAIGATMVIGAIAIMVAAWRMKGGPLSVLRVAVYRSGRVTVDGQDTALAMLAPRLAALRRDHGMVVLYREGAEGDRHPNAQLVARAIAESGVPLSLTSRPDFSDEVLSDGTTRPR